MRIAIGADHAGFALKEHLVGDARRGSATRSTIAAPTARSRSTIPPICADVGAARSPSGGPIAASCVGGSGQGEQIAANKVPGVRAALCNDLYTARLSRQHNDANVLAMGGRIVGFGLADEIVDAVAGDAVRGRTPSAAARSDCRDRTARARPRRPARERLT